MPSLPPARRINLGRIAGVFAYCYYLCKAFILRYALKGIIGFLGVLLGYLAQFLVRTGFYDWLGRIGGWVSKKNRLSIIIIRAVQIISHCICSRISYEQS